MVIFLLEILRSSRFNRLPEMAVFFDGKLNYQETNDL
jgi:hypothetical protein